MDLHLALGQGFSVNSASSAIHEFIDICRRLGPPRKANPPGLSYLRLFPGYQKIVNGFVNRIAALSYDGMPMVERTKLSAWGSVQWRIRQRLLKRWGKKAGGKQIFVPVEEQTFLQEANQFIDDLFSSAGSDFQGKPVVLNQGGSYWRPVFSTQYYGDRHVVVVNRDPRGIFASFIFGGYAYPGRDVKLFCKWYRQVMSLRDQKEWASPLVTTIQYESFVLEHKRETEKLCDILHLSPTARSTYDPEASKRNVDKFMKILSRNELDVIEKELSDYLFL
ncbi:hypothetical protein [Desulfonatronovibrio hydrogenovorans]|uniref:hypothetical protein n=1 Tax=Desulfonatronovibrio hydrogenovorans TaxID=53245 RepID=UPI0012376E63|nr:hypothetical protein [Desulfonatronovibrio hydrogenovorans]